MLLARAFLGLLTFCGTAIAQPVGQLEAGRIWGNPTVSRAPASPATPSSIIDRAISNSQGAILYRGASTWDALAKSTTATRYLSNTGTNNAPLWAQVILTNGVSGVLPFGNGGFGINTATSGGVPYFSSSSTVASSGALGSGQVVVGGGVGAAPSASENATLSSGALTLGQTGSVAGSVVLSGSSSGTATLRVPAAAGASTVFQLPSTNGTSGYLLQTDGSGNTSWAAASGSGTVTSVATGGILTGGPITSSGTLNVNATITPQHRITLTSNTPVLTATVSGATTVFVTPYVGNIISLYNGTNFIPTAFAETSQATTDTTKSPAAVGASSNYDIFCWVDSGTNRCTRGPAWSSATARGTGAGTTELTIVNGIYLNANSITNGPAASRGTYMGTIRSNASSTIDFTYGSAASGCGTGNLMVWNNYNRVRVVTTVIDTTSSWTYGTPTWRAPNGNTNTCRVNYVSGLAIDIFDGNYFAYVQNPAGASTAYIATGYDSTTGVCDNTAMIHPNTTTGGPSTCFRTSLGSHYMSALEYGTSSSAATFYGGAVSNFRSTLYFSGLF